MDTVEMKGLLVQKFKDENCYFTEDDVTIEQENSTTTITIKDYEHAKMIITEEQDDYFGYVLYVKDTFEDKIIGMFDSKIKYPYETAILNIGYHIANTF